jgi:hypothetical protein
MTLQVFKSSSLVLGQYGKYKTTWWYYCKGSLDAFQEALLVTKKKTRISMMIVTRVEGLSRGSALDGGPRSKNMGPI